MARRRSSRSKSTGEPKPRCAGTRLDGKPCGRDRKSTRLNSSHSQISYAVFCLKKKKRLGSDHPEVAIRLNNLARLYSDQGRNAEAELLSQRALAISEQALGTDHPVTAHALQHLAGLYWGQGKYAEAELLFQDRKSTRLNS